eukprot:NODE_392_length_8143_cov_0.403282.p2 type:complete len:475 gc:universal NODE_392_length_8143_cov_0.403282:5511-6935(+)
MVQFLILLMMATDCDMMMLFFRALNMHITDTSKFNLIPVNCCNYNDNYKITITCTSNTITRLSLNFININGTIDGSLLPPNITFIEIRFNANLASQIPNNLPDSLTFIDFMGNKLYGPLPTVYPSSLVQFRANSNYLTGPLPRFPDWIQSMTLSSNLLHGDIDHLPNSLTFFSANGCNFNGSIVSLPPNITFLSVSYSKLSGNIKTMPSKIITYDVGFNLMGRDINVNQNWPISLTEVYIGDNYFYGIFPIQLMSARHLSISNNRLTGCFNQTLPCLSCLLDRNQFKGPITFSQPGDIYLQNNSITNVTILDASYLNDCILDHNPMLGNLGRIFVFYRYTPMPPTCSTIGLFNSTGYQCDNVKYTTSIKLLSSTTSYYTFQETKETTTIEVSSIQISELQSTTSSKQSVDSFDTSHTTSNLIDTQFTTNVIQRRIFNLFRSCFQHKSKCSIHRLIYISIKYSLYSHNDITSKNG